jgi:hypothetical protein
MRTLRLTGVALATAVLLAACGSSAGLIPADSAAILHDDLANIQLAFSTPNCTLASAYVAKATDDFYNLPQSIDAKLLTQLQDAMIAVARDAQRQCHTSTATSGPTSTTGASAATGPTGTTGTSSTSSSTTASSTTSASTTSSATTSSTSTTDSTATNGITGSTCSSTTGVGGGTPACDGSTSPSGIGGAGTGGTGAATGAASVGN